MYKIIESVISILIMVGGIEISKKFADTFYEIHLKRDKSNNTPSSIQIK